MKIILVFKKIKVPIILTQGFSLKKKSNQLISLRDLIALGSADDKQKAEIMIQG
jgi:hypothetical protein